MKRSYMENCVSDTAGKLLFHLFRLRLILFVRGKAARQVKEVLKIEI